MSAYYRTRGDHRHGVGVVGADTGAFPDFEVFYDCLVAGFDEVLSLAD